MPGAIRVRVSSVLGSAPRGAGAEMTVRADCFEGTIGGGALEWMAIAAARDMLASGGGRREIQTPLGPELGQCCGGRVTLTLTRAAGGDAPAERTDGAVLIFGAGHVGGALARALAPLPLDIRVIDEREDWLSPLTPIARTVLTALPEAEIAAAPPGAAFVVLTHDHALDFLIVQAALARGDAAYVGMIGSAAKRGRLLSALRGAKISADGLICPIGAGGARDKRPAVIAAATAAEIAAALLKGDGDGDRAVGLG